jgi:hypothetical protein
MCLTEVFICLKLVSHKTTSITIENKYLIKQKNVLTDGLLLNHLTA